MNAIGRGLMGMVVPVLFAGALAGPAQAAPDWVAPASILPPGDTRAEVRIGFDANGKETIAKNEVVSQSPPIQTRVTFATREVGGAVVEERVLDSETGRYPLGSQIAVAPSGAAVACVTQLIGDPGIGAALPEYRALYRAAGATTWSDPELVAANLVDSQYGAGACIPSIGADGSAAVVVERTTEEPPASAGEPRRSQIVALVRDAGEGWGTPQVLSPMDRMAQNPQAEMDDAGNLTVAWRERWAGNTSAATADDRHTMKLATRASSNGIFSTSEPPDVEGNFAEDVFRINFASNDAGRAVISWQQDSQVWGAVRADSSGSFGVPQPLVSAGSSSSPGAVGVAPNGTAYIAYRVQASSFQDTAGMIRQRPGASWTTHQAVGPTGVLNADGRLAFLGDDAFFVNSTVIQPRPPGKLVMYGVRWRDDQPLADASRDLIEPESDSPTITGFGPDRQGGLFVSYLRPPSLENLNGDSRTVAFDGSPPLNRSLNVPATATPGTGVNLSAEFADRWSPLGATSWDFGDGGTATGSAVSHAWAAPGTYTVKATGTDTRGNARQVTAQITVSADGPGPGPGAGPDTDKPVVKLNQPTCGKRKGKACKSFRKTRKAWRSLKGTATDNVGVTRVEVAVARKNGKKFDVLNGKRFKRGQTGAQAAKSFGRAIVNGQKWGFSVPKSAKPGQYTFRVRAHDAAGNVSATVTKKVKLR